MQSGCGWEGFENALVTFGAPGRGGVGGDVGEEGLEVLAGDVPEAEEFDTRGVDDLAAEVEGEAAGGGGGVAAFAGIAADGGGAEDEGGLDGVDEGGFA